MCWRFPDILIYSQIVDTMFLYSLLNLYELADAFNEYFVNTGQKLSCQIIPVHQHSHYQDNETKKRMQLEVVNEDNINEAINRLINKSSYSKNKNKNKNKFISEQNEMRQQ